jgi:hypothetical protein
MSTTVELQEQKGCQQEHPINRRNSSNSMNVENRRGASHKRDVNNGNNARNRRDVSNSRNPNNSRKSNCMNA